MIRQIESLQKTGWSKNPQAGTLTPGENKDSINGMAALPTELNCIEELHDFLVSSTYTTQNALPTDFWRIQVVCAKGAVLLVSRAKLLHFPPKLLGIYQ